MEPLHESKSLSISCPICRSKKIIKIPTSIVDKSKQLTTISIPKGKICNHHFQVFIDKNFIIRGFQKVDYELKEMQLAKQKLQSDRELTLKEIYDEFWEYISNDNEAFREFISKDRRRKKNLNAENNHNPYGRDFIPHVCKNLE